MYIWYDNVSLVFVDVAAAVVVTLVAAGTFGLMLVEILGFHPALSLYWVFAVRYNLSNVLFFCSR